MREKDFTMEEDKNLVEHPILGDPTDQFGENYDFIINVELKQSDSRAYLRLFSGVLLVAEDGGELLTGNQHFHWIEVWKKRVYVIVRK